MERVADWNVVVTAEARGYRSARRWLARFGAVGATDYYNVLVMRVADVQGFCEALRRELVADPDKVQGLGRVMPLSVTFRFQRVEEFEREACRSIQPWVDRLRARRFHVRIHRRGFRGRLSSQHEELFLDHFLMAALAGDGSVIDFEDPDLIIALETVGQRGGMSCWDRAQRERYGFLKLD
ncbi:MAG TPA: hypothetical protein VKA14_06815 [Gammaproteobacteria bacterium]|nr:hypothetical protein [Gammaproteobacteria bacterium]